MSWGLLKTILDITSRLAALALSALLTNKAPPISSNIER